MYMRFSTYLTFMFCVFLWTYNLSQGCRTFLWTYRNKDRIKQKLKVFNYNRKTLRKNICSRWKWHKRSYNSLLHSMNPEILKKVHLFLKESSIDTIWWYLQLIFKLTSAEVTNKLCHSIVQNTVLKTNAIQILNDYFEEELFHYVIQIQ